MSERYAVLSAGNQVLGHRVLREGQWYAVGPDERETPAKDGAHAAAILQGRVALPSRKRRGGRAQLAGREPISSLAKPLKLVIAGAPRSKNTGKVTRSGKVIPPAPYRRWLKAALIQAEAERVALGFRGTLIVPVVVSCRFYLDADRSVDEDRLKVGIGDFLKAGGGAAFIVDDDRKRLKWGAVSIEVDRVRPRVEINIAVVPTEKESQR